MPFRSPSLFLVAFSLFAGCQFSRPGPLSGTVNVAPALLGKAMSPNAVVFVVARNKGGVPVAVRRIVNPNFPCHFTIGPGDLILPGAWSKDLTLTARLATRLGPDDLPASDVRETIAVAARAGVDAHLYLDTPAPSAWTTARLPTPNRLQ